jgi:hypothetical protein
MGDLSNSSNQNTEEMHVKKHDHSTLGKHTKKDKQKYLEGLKITMEENNPSIDNNLSQKDKADHVKKHDHSILGKHTKKDKQDYLENLGTKSNSDKKTKKSSSDNTLSGKNTNEHEKKHDHSILGKHTKEDKEKYLEELKNRNNYAPIEEETDLTNELEVDTTSNQSEKYTNTPTRKPLKRKTRRRY